MSTNALDAEKLLAEVKELRDRLRDEKIRHYDELRQFAYAVSHDLREPLRMVKGYTQLLELHEQRHDPDRQEFLRYIAEAVERTERLLADLVTYSLQLKPLDQPESHVDAEAVLGAVLLVMESSIHDSGAQITHDPLPRVMFDFERLSQLFRELIANAIKFRTSGSALQIHISASASEQGTTFSVRDNGAGIDPRYHDQIFEVFKRLHGREFPGSGMGLAVCKRIVEQHGGTIWVESESEGGNGATFRFRLPQ
jgi:light-regulated signal transduction histidine kinase (bacteriophytochrome)